MLKAGGPEIKGHSPGMPRWPAAASRFRVAGSSGLAPCALSHWISFLPVIAGSRPVSLGGRGSFKGRLVLQIVTDIVFIMALKIVNGPAQDHIHARVNIPRFGQQTTPFPK